MKAWWSCSAELDCISPHVTSLLMMASALMTEEAARVRTTEQWTYGAILDYWGRWSVTRRSVWRKRPRRKGSAAITFALAAAASVAPHSSHVRYSRHR
jgi:hypothetical protein